METDKMRVLIKSAYFGPRWRKKVDKMTDAQIIAIYYSLVKQGRIQEGSG